MIRAPSRSSTMGMTPASVSSLISPSCIGAASTNAELVAGARLVGEDVGDDVAKGRHYLRVYVGARNSNAPRSSYSRGPAPVFGISGSSVRRVRLMSILGWLRTSELAESIAGERAVSWKLRRARS